MGNTSSTNDKIDKVLNPDRNGLSESVKKTNEAVAVSVAKTNEAVAVSNASIKSKIDESNKKIGENLQTNLALTKSALDQNLAATKRTIDYGALQEATSVLSKIASVNPIFYLSLEAINAGTDGKSNKYLNKSDSTNNPLFETFSGLLGGDLGAIFGFGENNKQLEQPAIYEKPTSIIEPTPTPDSYSKYAQFESNPTISKDNTNNTELYITLGLGVGAVALLAIASKNMKT